LKFFTLITICLSLIELVFAKNQYTGVNESGAEFGQGEYPGTYNKHYIYPDVKAIQASIDQGMNIFRVGFAWERLQRSLNAEFDATEFGRLDEVINYITSNGAVAIINPHNFARYKNAVIGTSQVPNSAFSNLWKRLAQKYKNNQKVWFGLVNEPHDMPTAQWFAAARDAVDTIRATGANNNVLVPGNAYTGAWNWKETFYGESNASVALRYFSSADKNIIFETHQYFDSDYSGTHEQCVQRPCNKLFVNFVEWLKANNLKGFIGEFGAAINRDCKACVEEAINYLEQNSANIVGWAWWAAGPWWGNYMYSLEPKGNKFPEQMTWLKPHLNGPSSLTTVPTFDFADMAPNGFPYCQYCEVGATGGDGSLWGWENEQSCVVDYGHCKNEKPKTTTTTTTKKTTTTTKKSQPTNDVCFSINLGYKCCSGCDIVYVDQDGNWGVENDQWCGIKNSCNAQSCWSESLGFPCCQNTKEVYYTDNDGNWGVENNNWCGII